VTREVAPAATTAAPATSRRPRLTGDAVSNRLSVTREPRAYTGGALCSPVRAACDHDRDAWQAQPSEREPSSTSAALPRADGRLAPVTLVLAAAENRAAGRPAVGITSVGYGEPTGFVQPDAR
jgi:hypothetical protein